MLPPKIQTTNINIKLDWRADTGSPKSFVNKDQAQFILQNSKGSGWQHRKGDSPKYRCFNNVEMPILGSIQLISLPAIGWQ